MGAEGVAGAGAVAGIVTFTKPVRQVTRQSTRQEWRAPHARRCPKRAFNFSDGGRANPLRMSPSPPEYLTAEFAVQATTDGAFRSCDGQNQKATSTRRPFCQTTLQAFLTPPWFRMNF